MMRLVGALGALVLGWLGIVSPTVDAIALSLPRCYVAQARWLTSTRTRYGSTVTCSSKTTARSSGTSLAATARTTRSFGGEARKGQQQRRSTSAKPLYKAASIAEGGSALVTERCRCCICGVSTVGASDYVAIVLTGEGASDYQELSAHSDCLQPLMHSDFRIEVKGDLP